MGNKSHRKNHKQDEEIIYVEEKQGNNNMLYVVIAIAGLALWLLLASTNVRLHHFTFDFKITESVGLSVGFVNEKEDFEYEQKNQGNSDKRK